MKGPPSPEALEKLDLVGLLTLLEDVSVPPAVAYTPQTPAWGVVGVLIVAGLLFLGLRRLRRWRAQAYRRDALVEVDALALQPEARAAALTGLATIVRRTALTAYPRLDVAPLVGREWLEFLDDSYGGTGFTRGPGQMLAEGPYQPERDGQPTRSQLVELESLVRTWIRRHRV